MPLSSLRVPLVADPAIRPGVVVVLNGSTCSGKTTIATALRSTRVRPYFFVSVEHFHVMRPVWGPGPVHESVARSAAMHHSIAAISRTGWGVVVEEVLVVPAFLRECAHVLADYPAYFVGLRCPLDVLERRERERGRDDPGTTRRLHQLVHAHGVYDLELDTSTLSAEECAFRINRRIDEGPPPSAFTRLKASLH